MSDHTNHPEPIIKLVFFGDLAPVGRIGKICREGSLAEHFAGFRSFLSGFDFRVANLECPLTNTENKIVKSGPHLKAGPEGIHLLKYLGIDGVTLSNNHVRDYSDEGIRDTLQLCSEARIMTCGAGNDPASAAQPLIFTVHGIKTAVLNYSESEFNPVSTTHSGSNPLDLLRIPGDIARMKESCHHVIVVIHGGKEMYPYPTPFQKRLFRFVAGLGATAVIGHHSHCIGGFEVISGTPVFYSLGNFIFDEPGNPASWYEGAGISLTLTGKSLAGYEWITFSQCSQKPEILIHENDDRNVILKRIEELSRLIADDIALGREWQKIIEAECTWNIKVLQNLSKPGRLLYRVPLFRKWLVNPKRMVTLLNLIRCETHRDVLTGSINHWLENH